MDPTVVLAVTEIEQSTIVLVPTMASGASGSRLTIVTTKTSRSSGDNWRDIWFDVNVLAAVSVTALLINTVSLVFFSAMDGRNGLGV